MSSILTVCPGGAIFYAQYLVLVLKVLLDEIHLQWTLCFPKIICANEKLVLFIRNVSHMFQLIKLSKVILVDSQVKHYTWWLMFTVVHQSWNFIPACVKRITLSCQIVGSIVSLIVFLTHHVHISHFSEDHHLHDGWLKYNCQQYVLYSTEKIIRKEIVIIFVFSNLERKLKYNLFKSWYISWYKNWY